MTEIAYKYEDNVQENTTAPGTATISLGGATTGSRTFSSAFNSGDVVMYGMFDGTDWENGIGTLTSGSPWTLSRDQVFSSSNSGSKVNFTTNPLVGCAWSTEGITRCQSLVDVYANLPAAGHPGRRFYRTDGHLTWVDDGTNWRPLIDGCVVGTQPSAAANWTAVNSGGTLALSDSNGSLLYTGVNDGSILTMRGFSQAIGSYTLIEAAIAYEMAPTNSGFTNIGVGMRNSSTADVYEFHFTLNHSSSITSLESSNWTGNTSRGTQVTVAAPFPANSPYFLRVRSDGTYVYAEWSRTRVTWQQCDKRTLASVFGASNPNTLIICSLGYQGPTPRAYFHHVLFS